MPIPDDQLLAVLEERVKQLTDRIERLEERIGALESKANNLSAGLAASRERLTPVIVGGIILLVASGAVSVVIMVLLQ